MATKKVQQTPILEQVQETKSTASESVLTPNKTTSVKKNKIAKSRRRTSIEEFSLVKCLRPEVKAGFTAWLKGQNFHFDDEWEKLFEDYTNRTL